MNAPSSPLTRHCPEERRRWRGFTMVEMLVAMAVFTVLMAILLSVINQSTSIWSRAQNEVGSYQSGRYALNLITRTLSQSRIGGYNDYDNAATPTRYTRHSDLNFVIAGAQSPSFGQGNSIFFQAPVGRTLDPDKYGGLPGLLNSVGYYVTYGKQPSLPPFLQTLDRNRFRLMQFLSPTERMTVYSETGGGWYQTDLAAYSDVIADNVILVLFWPRLSRGEDPEGDDLTNEAGTKYLYDSRTGTSLPIPPVTANQEAPLVQVTIVVIDEATAGRLPNTATPPTEITSKLQGLFGTATETGYKTDLAELERRLAQDHMGYRVLTSTVPLREAKWFR